MASRLLAYVSNDNLLQVIGLRDVDDAYVNDATVVCTGVATADGTAVSGDSFPKTLSYVTASNGEYRATLEDTLALVAGVAYVATVTVTVGGAAKARFDVPFTAAARTVL